MHSVQDCEGQLQARREDINIDLISLKYFEALVNDQVSKGREISLTLS